MNAPLNRKKIKQPAVEQEPDEEGFFAGTFKILLVCIGLAVCLWIITLLVKASGFR